MARIALVALSFLFMTQAHSEDERRIDISNGLGLKAMRANITSIVNPVRACTANKTDERSRSVLNKAALFNNAVAKAVNGCDKDTIKTQACTKLILAAVQPLNDLWFATKNLDCPGLAYNASTSLWTQPAAPATEEKPAAKAPAPKQAAAAPAPATQPSAASGARTNAQELQSFNNMIAMIKKKNGKFATPEIAAKADLLLRAEKTVNAKCSDPKMADACTKLLNASKQPFLDYANLTKAQLKVVTPKK